MRASSLQNSASDLVLVSKSPASGGNSASDLVLVSQISRLRLISPRT